MSNRTLRSIFAEHGGKVSDKWSMYLDEYHRLFTAYRDLPVRLLEIGVQNGGSLEIWDKFFAYAEKLVGCDNDPVCAQLRYEDPKVAVVVVDANSDQAEKLILELSPRFDLIIDDGSHHSGDIIRSFARYFPHLSDGGLYVAEDLHCSYWQEYQGGLFHSDSSISFFKRLIDIINHEHWGINKTRSELIEGLNSKYDVTIDDVSLASIHSIEFINSMCVIKKAPSDANVLGNRFVVGTDALVCTAIMPFHGSSGLRKSQIDNQWSASNSSEETALLARTLEVASLNQSVSVRDIEIAKLKRMVLANAQEFSAQLDLVRQQLNTQQLDAAELSCQQDVLKKFNNAYLLRIQENQNALARYLQDAHDQLANSTLTLVP